MSHTIRSVVTVALVLVGFAGCQSVQNFLNAEKPTAHITNISIAGASLTGANLVFDINVDNPYDVALPLTQLGYSLGSNGKTFLTGNADLTGSIPAHGSKAIQVPATLKFAELLAALPTFKLGSSLPYDATLDLAINAPAIGPMRLPLTKSGALTIPKPY